MFSKHIRTFTTIALTGILALATLTGCSSKDEGNTTPSVTIAPTAEATPTAVVTPTSEVTPTAEITPSAEPTPTAAPAVELPSELPAFSLEHAKKLIDEAIISDSTYIYEQKTTYSKTVGNQSWSENASDELNCFPSFLELGIGTLYTDVTIYMDDSFNHKKEVYTLANGKQATIYYTKFGEALDYDGNRDYLPTGDTTDNGSIIYLYDYNYADSDTYYTCSIVIDQVTFSASYRKADNTLVNYSRTAEEYDDQERLVRKVSAICYEPGKGYTHVYETKYTYDESDNLVSVWEGVKTELEPLQTEMTTYRYFKDDDNRLTGWNTNGSDEPYFCVKYLKDGHVMIYRTPSESGDPYGTVIIPSESFLQNLLTTSHLRGEMYGGFLEGKDYLNEFYPDREQSILYEQDQNTTLSFEDGFYTCFYGELSEKARNRDTWYTSPDDFMKENVWCTLFAEFNKDRLLTGLSSTSGGDGYTYNYRYDAQKRLVYTYFFSYDTTIENSYTYDKNNAVTERVKTYELSDTGMGAVKTKTTYLYSYDKDGKLTGMTYEEAIINDNKEETACTSSLILYNDHIEYGDVTQFLNMTAGEVIDTIGRPYVYSYNGPDLDLNFGYNGGIHFGHEVSFMYDGCTETLNPSMKTLLVCVDNEVNGNTGKGIGNGMNSAMTYQQIKAILGDSLHGETELEEDNFGSYIGLAVRGDYRYLFWWRNDPTKTNARPDYIHISKTGLDWVARAASAPGAKDYVKNNEALFLEHSAADLATLRAEYKDVPVHKSSLLTTVTVDEHTTVEYYESAVYGRPEKKNADGDKRDGYEAEIECYDYSVYARCLSDGKHVTSYCVWSDNKIMDSTGTFTGNITNELYWQDDDLGNDLAYDAYRLSEGDGKNYITRVTINNYEDSTGSIPTDVWTVALFVNNESAPIVTRSCIVIVSNNGEKYDEVIMFAGGKTYPSVLSTLKKPVEGTRLRGQYSEEWSLYEYSSNMRILGVASNNLYGTYTYTVYLVVGDCLVSFYSLSEC